MELIRNRQNIKVLMKDYLLPNQFLKNNIRFKNKHIGERCFILGSGPSISKQNIKILKGEIVITQNHFHVHDDIKIVHPMYHCVVPFFHSKEFTADWIEWISTMEGKLPHDTQIFCHLNTRNIIKENKLFENRTHYLEVGLSPMSLKKAKVDISKRIMWVQTALMQCLTVALYMGFEKIYLLGCDMDSICKLNEPDEVRFYGHSLITKNAYETKNDKEHLETGSIFYLYWSMWVQFILFREYAKENNSEIINLTEGGILNCFERQSYNDIIL